jgi:hypothetical protein
MMLFSFMGGVSFGGRWSRPRFGLRITRRLHRLLFVYTPSNLTSSLENSDAYPVEVELLERLAGEAAAKALRAPFVLGDRDALIGLLEASGAGSVSVETHYGTARFPSIRTMVEADLRGWLPVMGVLLTEEQIQNILKEAESALAKYVTEDGAVVFNSPAHIVTGMAGAV